MLIAIEKTIKANVRLEMIDEFAMNLISLISCKLKLE
ncbi:hypothetical protein HMPREF1568_0435 [Providencia alcalifaciens PAL-3]|nr:hypothetical protein HMPREF1568_0435 [Providencia alcalifaciens PAL-3]EUD00528.1 hypothetical protein HMPREF1566_3025 [Providencia alcalifaciens PAL-1]